MSNCLRGSDAPNQASHDCISVDCRELTNCDLDYQLLDISASSATIVAIKESKQLSCSDRASTSVSLDHPYSKQIRCADPSAYCSGSNMDCNELSFSEFNLLCAEYVVPNHREQGSNCWPLFAGQNANNANLLDELTYIRNQETCTTFMQTFEQQQPHNYTKKSESAAAAANSPNDSTKTAEVEPFSPISKFLNDIDFNENLLDIRELEEYLDAPNDVTAQNRFELMMNEEEEEAETVDLMTTENSRVSISDDGMDLSVLEEFFPAMPLNNMMEMKNSICGDPSDYLETFVDFGSYCVSGAGLKSQLEDRSVPVDSTQAVNKMDCVGNDEVIMDAYRRKRNRNNLASQKSRRKRQERFKEMKLEEQSLNKRNADLLVIVSDLERQVANLKDIMMKAVTAR